PPRSATGQLDRVAERAQALGHALPVLPLDLDGAGLDRPAGTTEPPQLRGQLLQPGAGRGQAADHGHGLAGPARPLAEDPEIPSDGGAGAPADFGGGAGARPASVE